MGDYDYYVEKKRRLAPANVTSADAWVSRKSEPAAAPVKPAGKLRKLSFKETRELEGMESEILKVEQEIGRIENLFAAPDFHKTHATQTNALMADLAAHKEKLNQLFARWEELEAIKSGAAAESN